MKPIKKYIVALSTAFALLTSCSSFLEENPEDRFVIGNFYASESDAKAAVNAIYQQLYSIYDRNMFMLNALVADDEKNGLGMPNQFLQDLEYLRFNSENTFIRDMWRNNYSGISRANTAIVNIPSVTMNETLKARLVGEAKFLRGLFYFNLVRFFGDVPLILKLERISDAMLPRTPATEVYQQIISDLSDAAETLPVSYGSADMGRATAGAARILLGKVYLTIGEYQRSADVLAEVITHEGEYGYSLHEHYGDNWKPETETGKEAVLYIEYMDPPGRGNNAMVLCGPKYSIPGGFAVLGINNSNEADIPTMDLYNQFADNDERKAATFRTDFISLIDGSVHRSSIPLFVKYWEEGERIGGNSDANIHVLRYADALLLYAEALNEVGRTDEALTQLNRVRKRAFNSDEANYGALSKEAFREAVWQERRLELAFEGHRWFDLVRTGRLVQRMKDHAALEASLAEANKIEIGQRVQDHMVLMPIPQREIDLNPLLTQNTGY